MTAQSANRKFFELPDFHYSGKSNQNSDYSSRLLSHVKRNVIGDDKTFSGPFGLRKVVYADHIASGRSLSFIEAYLRNEVLPEYANTHTTTSVTSLQTTLFREEARDIVRNAVNASEYDAVIFTGSGCTGAVHKLIYNLVFTSKPIVIVGPFEHHSNLLPWRRLAASVVRIGDDRSGHVDLEQLEHVLQKLKTLNRPLVGCFSAASNITGILANVDDISELLHRYGALAFFDYAAAGPYVKIDMNPGPGKHKDAVFLSVHKFVGGVQTPGVLVAKKSLFRNDTPHNCGGGSVFFVRREHHMFLQDVEAREEGGTPPVVETIRAGLVFQLKEAITAERILLREHEITERVFRAWRAEADLLLLGSHMAPRLPVFSFLIRHSASGLFLHHNYVAALLNDLFGVQTRGGCACAGPYAQDLLGIGEDLAATYERHLAEDARLDREHLRRRREHSSCEILRPGFARLSFAYYMDDEEVEFIIRAVVLVAKYGWRLLPRYMYNPKTGEWRCRNHQLFKDRKWLAFVSYKTGEMTYTEPPSNYKGPLPDNYDAVIAEATKILLQTHSCDLADQSDMFSEVNSEVIHSPPHTAPFQPLVYSDMATGTRRSVSIIFNDSQTSPAVVCDSAGDCDTNLADSIRKLVIEDSVDGQSGPSSDTFPQDNNCVDGACFKPRVEMGTETTSVDLAVNGHTAAGTSQEKTARGIRWYAPPSKIFKPTIEAIEEFSMIGPGDRVIVCLSGGKDSLSLLHTLRQYQFYAKSKGVDFDLAAATVDPGTEAYDPRPLIPYLSALDMPYFYERQDILAAARATPDVASICAYCSRMKRGRLYHAARREGYNVLAMGQHLDDLAESFMMSMFHNGILRTMKASYTVREGDLRVIRPFVYVREKSLRQFATKYELPVIAENCPACFEAPKERHRVKQMLASQEVLHPRLFDSIREAIKPVMRINKTGVNIKSLLSQTDASEGDSDED